MPEDISNSNPHELTNMIKEYVEHKPATREELLYIKLQRKPLYRGLTPNNLLTSIEERGATETEILNFKRSIVEWDRTVSELRRELITGEGVRLIGLGLSFSTFSGVFAKMLSEQNYPIGNIIIVGVVVGGMGILKGIAEVRKTRVAHTEVSEELGKEIIEEALQPTKRERLSKQKQTSDNILKKLAKKLF